MVEIQGNLWDFYGRPNTIVLITTNGSIRKDGCAVMGRGCAAQAKEKFLGVETKLGKLLSKHGNEIYMLLPEAILTFPVKHTWDDAASLPLIRKSTLHLRHIALCHSDTRYILPRPGCGYGHRLWIEVEPIVRILPDNVLVIHYA